MAFYVKSIVQLRSTFIMYGSMNFKFIPESNF
jgi:hypothetical protein